MNSGAFSFSGCSTGIWCSTANFLTADCCNFMPRPAGLSGAVTAAATGYPASTKVRKLATAKSGVPKKTIFNFLFNWVVSSILYFFVLRRLNMLFAASPLSSFLRTGGDAVPSVANRKPKMLNRLSAAILAATHLFISIVQSIPSCRQISTIVYQIRTRCVLSRYNLCVGVTSKALYHSSQLVIGPFTRRKIGA